MTARIWSIPSAHFICRRGACAREYAPVLAPFLEYEPGAPNTLLTSQGDVLVEVVPRDIEDVVAMLGKMYRVLMCRCGKVGYDPLRGELVDRDEATAPQVA